MRESGFSKDSVTLLAGFNHGSWRSNSSVKPNLGSIWNRTLRQCTWL